MSDIISNPVLFKCAECELHYNAAATALTCAAWCLEHKSFNLDITALSIERNSPK